MRFLLLAILLASPLRAEQANRLQGSASPYLQQHATNPVDWYPWGDEALARARAENKPIFVSVGYASCYWCHVMREESFEDQRIADLINQNFIAIKIDRERRPDLDEQFMLATQVLTGSGGWPNNLFLTPLGDPFFAGTYFPPDDFARVLEQIAALWREDPGALNARGFRTAQVVKSYLAPRAGTVELTPQRMAAIRARLLARLDEFNGGFGTAPKFPRESLLEFLLEEALRTGDGSAMDAVTLTLDGMIAGGIHDQLGGGFHRYATDPAWQIPHFEKMLYDQALIGSLLARRLEARPDPAHRRALERLIAWLLRDMHAPGGGFYAARDAASPGPDGTPVEGAYYLWTPDQVRAVLGNEAPAILALFDITPEGELHGANILHTTLPPPDLTAHEAALDRLLAARARRPAPAIDDKVLLGWNGATISMLAQAAHALDRPDLWQIAAETAEALIRDLAHAEGYHKVLWRGTPSLQAQLPDLAAFGLALVALHDTAPSDAARARWLREARLVADQILGRFGSTDQGLRMSATPRGFAQVIQVDDGELASGNAMALRLLSRISRRMEAPELGREAARLAATLSGVAVEIPGQRAGLLAAIRELEDGETGPLRYVSGGAVRVELERSGQTARLRLTMAPGWHINAHEPLEDYFIPTTLLLNDTPIAPDGYPPAVTKTLGFNPEPLALYEGSLTLSTPARAGDRLRLSLQACSNEVCLEPEEVIFTLW